PRSVKNLAPVHLYLGTARVVARLLLLDREELLPGEKGFAQCRLESPLATERRDRFIIRSYSPVTTIGGGIIVDPFPGRHRRFRQPVLQQLTELEQGLKEDRAFVLKKLDELKLSNFSRLEKATRLSVSCLESILKEMELSGQVIKIGESFTGYNTYRQWERLITSELERFHKEHPLFSGISRARLKSLLPSSISSKEFDTFLDKLGQQQRVLVRGDLVSRFNFIARPSPGDRDKLEQIAGIYRQAGWVPPAFQETLAAAGIESSRQDEFESFLLSSGELVKISEELYFHRDTYREAVEALGRHFRSSPTLTLAKFRDITGSSRKIIQPLLEHFDRQKYTKRVGDYRVAVNLKS
ncbi:MAG TPA: selenocysteine-specific translation elongation factor, partial [Firmicutes bacterium]|nr:selenocysteine-specific translation elongation factor [Bacillota bacterium]